MFFLFFRKLKEKRRKIQEKNKEKKEALKHELKQKSLEGIKRKQKENEKLLKKATVEGGQNEENDEEDNDADWYRKEVGEEPDDGNPFLYFPYFLSTFFETSAVFCMLLSMEVV